MPREADPAPAGRAGHRDRSPARRPGSAADGFGPDAQRFLSELQQHNNRDFFTANRERFDRELAEPMSALLDSLPERYQPFKVFRMNRDVRFSPDKSPYKAQCAAMHTGRGVQWYLHLDPHGFLAACGSYLFSTDQLHRYRDAVADERSGTALAEVVATLRRKRSLDLGPGGADALKTAPRGYPADHPRIELLRMKGVIGSRGLTATPTLRHQAELRRFVLATFESCAPLTDWIAEHVGADPLDHDHSDDRGLRRPPALRS